MELLRNIAGIKKRLALPIVGGRYIRRISNREVLQRPENAVVIRALMYLMQTYNEYFKEHKANLYSSKKVEMPKPELYVIFTGKRSKKQEYITLSEEFFDGQECGIG